MVREYLDKRKLGTNDARELRQIELIAEEGDYPGCHIRLMMQTEDSAPGDSDKSAMIDRDV